ncbi:MAG: hypothetical protein QXR84_06470 [Candidatus Bathyarchaeia archaeon]|nr:hypothetical protein [Candidatus Bathyarchaeota archaeon]
MKDKKAEKLREVFENFKVLVNNLVPLTLDQAEWICNEVERLCREHPDLRAKIKEFHKISDKMGLSNELLIRILDEIEEKEGKRHKKRRMRRAGRNGRFYG